MRVVDRDYEILREVERWRVCLSRHLRCLAGFGTQRACDRRLRVLLDSGFITRQKILYGVPSLYSLTHKGKMLIGANKRQEKVRVENIVHDITVLDVVIHFVQTMGVQLQEVISEKELHAKDGFSVRKHRPDFIFTKDGRSYCVEVELTLKSKERLEKNIKKVNDLGNKRSIFRNNVSVSVRPS